jgi:hypothetical protein
MLKQDADVLRLAEGNMLPGRKREPRHSPA